MPELTCADLQLQINALKAEIEELRAARPTQPAQPQAPARPAQPAQPQAPARAQQPARFKPQVAEGDPQRRSPKGYAKAAQQVLCAYAVPGAKCYVHARSVREYTLQGVSGVPETVVFSVYTLNALVRALRSGKDAAAYVASLTEDTPPWEEAA